jgi:hypothetical protein
MGMNVLSAWVLQEYFRRSVLSAFNRAALRIVAMACALICAFTFVAGAGAGLFVTRSSGAADNERVLWKAIGRAQLKLEDKTPLAWNVYQTEKKKQANLVLVQLGRRFIALDIKGKVAYYVFPTDLQAKGADFESGDLFVRSRVMPTTAWSVRDVGPAEMIKLTLGDYGRALDVELPHMPDLRAFY